MHDKLGKSRRNAKRFVSASRLSLHFIRPVLRVLYLNTLLSETGSPGEIMKTYSTTVAAGVALTTLLFAYPAYAHDHDALNGTWTLIPAKSDFAGQPVVQTGT